MKESSVVWTYTRAARRLAGTSAGKRLAEHWLIRRLLDARDEHLAALTDGTSEWVGLGDETGAGAGA